MAKPTKAELQCTMEAIGALLRDVETKPPKPARAKFLLRMIFDLVQPLVTDAPFDKLPPSPMAGDRAQPQGTKTEDR